MTIAALSMGRIMLSKMSACQYFKNTCRKADMSHRRHLGRQHRRTLLRATIHLVSKAVLPFKFSFLAISFCFSSALASNVLQL